MCHRKAGILYPLFYFILRKILYPLLTLSFLFLFSNPSHYPFPLDPFPIMDWIRSKVIQQQKALPVEPITLIQGSTNLVKEASGGRLKTTLICLIMLQLQISLQYASEYFYIARDNSFKQVCINCSHLRLYKLTAENCSDQNASPTSIFSQHPQNNNKQQEEKTKA
jgi:hypothetical protein